MRPIHRSLVGAATLALALTVTCVPSADAAVPRNGQITLLKAVGSRNQCADSNKAGDVYPLTCYAQNGNQQWKWTAIQSNLFTLRDVATGRCLADNGGGAVTRSCDSSELDQQWFALELPGLKLRNHATGYYLTYNGITSDDYIYTNREFGSDWHAIVVG
ncbi:RICIN domain-containing protein [Kitasatospora sp. NPDC001574]